MLSLCEVWCYVPSYWELFKSRRWEWIVRERAVSFIDCICTAWGWKVPPFMCGWVLCKSPKRILLRHISSWVLFRNLGEGFPCVASLAWKGPVKELCVRQTSMRGFLQALESEKSRVPINPSVKPEARFGFNVLGLCHFAMSKTGTECPFWRKWTIKITFLGLCTYLSHMLFFLLMSPTLLPDYWFWILVHPFAWSGHVSLSEFLCKTHVPLVCGAG